MMTRLVGRQVKCFWYNVILMKVIIIINIAKMSTFYYAYHIDFILWEFEEFRFIICEFNVCKN